MIEEFLINYLNGKLAVEVYGDIPTPMPTRFITVEKTGSSELNYIQQATIAIQSWAETRYEAMVINEMVKNAMKEAVELDEISRSHCRTDYNYTDTTTKRYRYQAVFEVVFY